MFVSSDLFPVIDSTPRSWSRHRRRYRQNWLAKHCSKRAGDRTGYWRVAHDRHRHFLSDGWLFAFGRMHVRAVPSPRHGVCRRPQLLLALLHTNLTCKHSSRRPSSKCVGEPPVKYTGEPSNAQPAARRAAGGRLPPSIAAPVREPPADPRGDWRCRNLCAALHVRGVATNRAR